MDTTPVKGKTAKFHLAKIQIPLWLVIILLYAAWRITFLILAHPTYLFLFEEEEKYRGMIAHEILAGLRMPFYDYRADNYSGGSLVLGIFLVPFFLLFGETAFSLKIFSVFVFAAALGFWFVWLKKYASQKIAILFAVFFIFSPPAFTAYSLVTLGDHPETILFAGAALLLFFDILHQKGNKNVKIAVLGILSGFGIWFSYIFGIFLLTMCIFWILMRKEKSIPELLQFSFFALIGFSPWLLGGFAHDYSGLLIGGGKIWDYFSGEHFIERFLSYKKSAPYLILTAFADYHVVDANPLMLVINFYRALILVPLIIAPFLKPKLSATVLFSLLYLAIFCLTSQLTPFHALRYYIPTQPFVFCVVVHAVDLLQRQFKRPVVIIGFITITIVASLFFHFRTFNLKYRGQIFNERGYRYDWLVQSPFCDHHFDCLYKFEHFKYRLERKDEELFLSGLASLMVQELDLANISSELKALEEGVPEYFYPYLYYFLGMEWMTQYSWDWKRAEMMLQSLPPRRADFYRMIKKGMLDSAVPDLDQPLTLEELQSEERIFKEDLDMLAAYRRRRAEQWARFQFSQKGRMVDVWHGRYGDFMKSKHWMEGIGAFFYQEWAANPRHPLFSPGVELSNLTFEEQKLILVGAGRAGAHLGHLDGHIWQQLFEDELSHRQRAWFRKGIAAYFRFDFKESVII